MNTLNIESLYVKKESQIKFQVLNDKGVLAMETHYVSCIPDDLQLSAMSKAGYKFKVNGKIVSAKKVREARDNF